MVPTPTLPFERILNAVVVAPVFASAKIDSNAIFESEEVAVIVNLDVGEVVLIPIFEPDKNSAV